MSTPLHIFYTPGVIHPHGRSVRVPAMAQLTDEQRQNVQQRIKQLLESMTEGELEDATGIPQATINAAHNRGKIGIQTARRLADYLGAQGETLETLLAGMRPAGHYLPRDMKNPIRGRLLDGLRGSVSKDILDEVFAIEVPHGSREWTLGDWLQEVHVRVMRAERLGRPAIPLLPPSGGTGRR